MKFSFSVTAWLLSVSPGTPFTIPHARARFTAGKLFAKDDANKELLAAYARDARGASPTIPDAVAQAKPDPPAELPIPDIPSEPVDNIKDAILSTKTAVAESMTSSTPPPPVAEGKAPILTNWFASAGSDYKAAVKSADQALLASPIDADSFDRAANLKEKLAIMKGNALGGFTGGVDKPHTDTGGMFDLSKAGELSGKVVGGASAAAASAATAFDIEAIATACRIDEFGMWYLVGATFVWGLLQRKAGREDAEDKFETKLTALEAKAQEAADAATIAAKGASMAKRMVYKADTTTNLDVLEKTKLKAMEVDMETMKNDTTRLKTETSTLKASLKDAESKAASAEALLSAVKPPAQAPVVGTKPAMKPVPAAKSKPAPAPKAAAKAASVPVPAVESKPAPAPAPKSKPVPAPKPPAPTPVAKVEKEAFTQISEPASAPVAKSAKKVARKVPKKVAKTVRVKKIKKEVVAKATPAPVLKSPPKPAPEPAPKPVSETAPKPAPESAPKPVPETAPKSSPKPAPKPEPAPKPAPETVPKSAPKPTAEMAPKPAPETVPKPAPKAEAAPKPAPAPKSPPTPAPAPALTSPPSEPTSGDNPWAKLSPSGLKRKTVKDLSAYLTERGVTVTDSKGKSLKKAELLKAVGDL